MKSSIRRALSNRTPVPQIARSGGSTVFPLVGGDRGYLETCLRAYGRSGTVFAIVSLLAGAAAAPSWHLYKKQPPDGRRRYTTSDLGTDERIEVINHAALSLWRRPNQFFHRMQFCEGANQHYELTGETWWVVERGVATFPTGLWYVRPDRMEPMPDPNDFLVGYIYNGPDGSKIPLRLDEVIHEYSPDPLDPYRGAGPVKSILSNIDQMRYATDYQRNIFINGAEPGGIVQLPNKMTDTEFDEFVDRWRESHQGIARAGRVGVLENGAQWVPNGQTNRDLEYGNLRLQVRDELREAWRVSKPMLGLVDDVNRANAQAAGEQFGQTLVLPRLVRRRETLNQMLLPMFYPQGMSFDQIPVEFDFENSIKEIRDAALNELSVKATAAKVLVDAGYDPEMVLEVIGLAAMDYVGFNGTTPASPPQTAPAQELDEVDESGIGSPDEVENRLPTVTLRSAAKVSKSSVRYRKGTTEEHCGNCSMFHPDGTGTGTCDLVAGQIQADMVCDRWDSRDTDNSLLSSYLKHLIGINGHEFEGSRV